MRISIPIALIVAVSLLVACTPIQAPASSQPVAAQADAAIEADTQQPEPVSISRAADVPRISVDEAKAHFDNGTAFFVDARSQDSYDVEHIAGAMPRPSGEPLDLGTEIPKDQLIISYCT